MTRILPLTILFITVLLLIIAHASANIALINVSLNNTTAYLSSGDPQKVVVGIDIIPIGVMTYDPSTTLQMQTDLLNATWSVQVNVDGNPAVNASQQGRSMVINGGTLAYPPNRHVGLVVEIDGVIPPDPKKHTILFQTYEIDYQGNTIPGSNITLLQPKVPPYTPSQTTTAPPAPTPSPGLSIIAAMSALFFAVLVWTRHGI